MGETIIEGRTMGCSQSSTTSFAFQREVVDLIQEIIEEVGPRLQKSQQIVDHLHKFGYEIVPIYGDQESESNG